MRGGGALQRNDPMVRTSPKAGWITASNRVWVPLLVMLTSVTALVSDRF